MIDFSKAGADLEQRRPAKPPAPKAAPRVDFGAAHRAVGAPHIDFTSAGHTLQRTAAPPVQAAPPAAAPVDTSPLSMAQASTPGTGSLAQRKHFPLADLGTAGMTHTTNALEKVGTYTSGAGDLLGAVSRDLDAPPAGATPVERLRNSHVARALRLMGNDIAHLHNMRDVQDEYYLTGQHNLQTLSAQGDRTAQFMLQHPWFTGAATFAGELLDPVNYAPGGIATLLKRAQWLQDAYAAAKAAGRGFAAAHPAVAKHADALQEVLGSGARHLDAGVHPADVPLAHAARRGSLAAVPASIARGRLLTRQIFQGAQPEDIEPALMAAQRRAKEAWLHQQTLAHPALVQRAAQFRHDLQAAHAAGNGPKPSVPALNWQRILGKPSVYDLGEGNWFAQQALADLAPEEQAHVLKIAGEMELAQEGPGMHEITPAQARIANPFRGIMGHTTAITRNERPDILEGGEQVGFVPSRGIWFNDELLGSRGHLGVGEPVDQAKLLTLYRRKQIVAHDAQLPLGDSRRILGDAVPEGGTSAYQALTPQQAVENFLARRYANLIEGRSQQAYTNVRSATGEPLVRKPDMPPFTSSINGKTATVIPQDAAALESLITGKQEADAAEATANRLGMRPGETQSYLNDRPPMRGVAAGRAREAQVAANREAHAAQAASRPLASTHETLSDLGPGQVKEQLRTKAELEGSHVQGLNDQAKHEYRQGERLIALKQRAEAAAKRIIEKYAPTLRAARDLGTQVAQRPGSRENLQAARAARAQAQERFSQALEQFGRADALDPKEYAQAVRGIAQSLLEAARAQQQPFWDALQELGGKIVPDQRWDPQLRRYVDAGEFADLPKRLRGSPKNLKHDPSAPMRHGNLDELADLIRERTGQDLSTSEVLDWFTQARKPNPGAVYADAREELHAQLGAQRSAAQQELEAARTQRGQARAQARTQTAAAKEMSPGDRGTVRGARALVGKNEHFGKTLAKSLAGHYRKSADSIDVVQRGLAQGGEISRRVGQRAIDIADTGHLRSSKALQRGIAGAQSRLAQTEQILTRAAAKANDRAKVAELSRQYAHASASAKLHVQSLYKRILKETPRVHVPPTYDPQVWQPIAHLEIHGRPLNWLDGEGKIMHRALVQQLEYDHAPGAAADAASEAMAELNFLARAGMYTNPAIHPLGNQGMLYAMETGDWKGWLDHAHVLLTGLDPALSADLLTAGPKAGNVLPNLLVKGARSLATYGWRHTARQMAEYASELEIAKRLHVYDETPPMGYDMPESDRAPQYDEQTGKLRGFSTPSRRDEQPAYLENVPIDRLPLPLRAKRLYRGFAAWNHKIVWETSEPLLAARWIRHFLNRGMDEAAAADAARDRLGSDKMTNWWRGRAKTSPPLLFPRWTRTVLWASMHLGLLHPATWNAPLQGTRVQREGEGAGDIPTGANPFAVALPDGTDANTGQAQFTMIAPHNPLGSTENMLAGSAFGDPRYGGIAGHLMPGWAYAAGRLLPVPRLAEGLAATAGTGLTGRYLPGTLISPHARATGDALHEMLQGAAGSVFMPYELGSEALQNPFTLPASLTGSTVYDKHAGFEYPDQP